MKFFKSIALLAFTTTAFSAGFNDPAEEFIAELEAESNPQPPFVSICPKQTNELRNRIKEREFTVYKAEKQLKELGEVFKGDIIVAPEFIETSFIILEGAYLRKVAIDAKGDKGRYVYAKNEFCEFLSKRAYLVH